MSVTQITSTGGTISVSPAGGTGVVDVEAVGTPIASLANGVGFLVSTDPIPFEHVANTNTYQVTAAELLGLAAVKPAVNAVAVANIASLSGAVTVDSQSLTAGQLVLLTAQTTQRQNGPWVVQSGAWTRPAWYYSDATGGGAYTTYASTSQAYAGVTMQSLTGTLYSGSTWQLTTSGTITIDSSSTAWSQVTVNSGLVPSPAGTTTNVQYNNNNILAGTGNFTFTSSTNTLTVGGNTGGSGTVTVGSTGSSSAGYGLTVESGAGGSTTGSGGTLLLKAGSAVNSGVGGFIEIYSGTGAGTGEGGNIVCVSGAGGTTSSGGSLNFRGGSGGTSSGLGGSIGFDAGPSNGSSGGGGIAFAGGDAAGSGAGGSVTFNAGMSATGVGGSLLFNPGSGAEDAGFSNDGTSQFITAEGNNALCIDQNGNTINGYLAGTTAGAGGLGAYVDQGYYLPSTAPVTGGSFTIPAYTSSAIFAPSGALGSQTFIFPTSPVDGQFLEISFTQAVTTPTWPSTVLGGPTAISANMGLSWRWIASLTKWVRRF